jgi:hypothetical protein
VSISLIVRGIAQYCCLTVAFLRLLSVFVVGCFVFYHGTTIMMIVFFSFFGLFLDHTILFLALVLYCVLFSWDLHRRSSNLKFNAYPYDPFLFGSFYYYNNNNYYFCIPTATTSIVSSYYYYESHGGSCHPLWYS